MAHFAVFRSRLKGCEGEVAALLSDQWSHVTLDWQTQHLEQNGHGEAAPSAPAGNDGKLDF